MIKFSLLLSILIPTVTGLIFIAFFTIGKKVSRSLCGISSFLSLITSTFLLLSATNELLRFNKPIEETYRIQAFTLYGNFNLMADWLSLPIALAISFLSALSALYSISYMESLEAVKLEPEMANYSIAYRKGLENPIYVPDRKPGEVPSITAYFGNLLIFASGMLGIVLSTNLIQLFIFFEAVIVPTFFLVYVWGSGPCRLIAIKYFVYMFVGGALLLLGIAWIYAATGSLDITALPNLMKSVDKASATGMAALIFIGFGMKAAIFPFHSWLPDFHAEAPVPIHALLSAVLIKCGVYGILRIVYQAFPYFVGGVGNGFAKLILLIAALITMIWGAGMALVQIQIKRILAYSSVNQIGYIMLGLSSGTSIGILGGLFHIITHGIAKGMLLLCAGSIIHQSHVRDVDKLGGLAKKMPLTAMATLIGGLSIAGFPPLAGFASEWMIFAGVLKAGYWYLALIGLLSTTLTMGYYLWAVRRIFFQEEQHKFKDVKESPMLMIIPISIEILLLIVLGVYPQLALEILKPASDLLLKFLGG
jgi:NADH-quinone oxidoreductase subunit M